jgi:hypothetical protein
MVWVVNATFQAPYRGKETRYTLYRTLGEPHGRSGRGGGISSPPEFDPRDVQSVGGCYADYGISPLDSSQRG